MEKWLLATLLHCVWCVYAYLCVRERERVRAQLNKWTMTKTVVQTGWYITTHPGLPLLQKRVNQALERLEVADPGDVWCQNANVAGVRYDEENKVELTQHHYRWSSSPPKCVNMSSEATPRAKIFHLFKSFSVYQQSPQVKASKFNRRPRFLIRNIKLQGQQRNYTFELHLLFPHWGTNTQDGHTSCYFTIILEKLSCEPNILDGDERKPPNEPLCRLVLF